MAIVYKTPAEIEKMRAANRVVCDVLDEVGAMVKPGATTGELGERAWQLVRKYHVTPAFLGYGTPPFPAVICISINDEVVHGIPSHERVIQDGDIVSLDFGVEKDGYFGDAARTVPAGAISSRAQRLLDATREALERAIAECHEGKRVADISRAIQEYVEERGYAAVRTFVGHGIGRRMHEEPAVPNFVGPGRNPRLKDGMVLAIEPMVNEGTWKVDVDPVDHWTARTQDGKLSAHFEHSVAVTRNGPDVLSRCDGGPQRIDSAGGERPGAVTGRSQTRTGGELQ